MMVDTDDWKGLVFVVKFSLECNSFCIRSHHKILRYSVDRRTLIDNEPVSIDRLCNLSGK